IHTGSASGPNPLSKAGRQPGPRAFPIARRSRTNRGGSGVRAQHKTGLKLGSLIKKSGELELSLANVPTPEPAEDEVVVRVEATPINPSDPGLLVGAADGSTAKTSGSKDSPIVT